MQLADIDIMRTAGLFVVRYGAEAPEAAQRRFEALTRAGYSTSAATGIKVLAAIERHRGCNQLKPLRRTPSINRG
jgi:hypothetical protein